MNMRWLILVLAIAMVATGFAGCNKGQRSEEKPLPDTLRVATLYSPTSYFSYRDEEMGFDYTLVKQFAEDKGLVLDLKVAPSMSKMIEMLDSGEVDLLAYDIPITAEFKGSVLPT